MKSAIMYWSKSGNTEKVARAIKDALEARQAEVAYLRVEEAGDLDWFDYDLVCLGFPSYSWRPPKPVDELLNRGFDRYRKLGRIKTGAPVVPGKSALIFVTYSGPHTGIDEATPAGDYAAQFFAHVGFAILDKLYVVGEFHGSEERSTLGRLGDIRGRPTEKDLDQVRNTVNNLLEQN